MPFTHSWYRSNLEVSPSQKGWYLMTSVFIFKTMKRLFLFVLVAIAINCHAQADYDSLKQKVLNMDMAINAIHHNMVHSHKEFKAGTSLIIMGTILTIAGSLILQDRDGTVTKANKNPTLIYLGTGVVTIGTIIQIDSHKWIGRAGREKAVRR